MKKRSKILILAALVLAAGWLGLRAERRRARESDSPSPAAAPRDATAGVGEIQLDASPSSGRVSIPQESVPVAEAHEPPEDAAAPPVRLWRARVVDGESQAPLANANLAVVEDDPFAEVDDGAWKPVRPDGTIELALATERSTLAVDCPGYAFAYVLPRSDEADPDRPQVVELWRAATLEVRVRDERSVRSEPAAVELLVKHSDLFTGNGSRSRGEVFAWQERLGADGALVFEGLPPHRELGLDARAGDTRLHHQLLFLSPGEREELEIFLRDGCAIAGRALTPEGEPVAGLEVWLVSEPSLPGRYFEEFEDTQDRATTDARGEFAFEDVAPGIWFVGPAAGKESEAVEPQEGGVPDRIAPMAERVKLRPGDGVVRVTLTCWSGLYIRGRVLDSADQTIARAHLRVLGSDVMCGGEVQEDGSFAVGPLVPGEYSLVAGAFQGTDRESAPVVARPGDENVELRLLPGGSVAVLVLDEQGQPAQGARMSLISSQDEYKGWGTTKTDAEGRVAFFGVEPGRYALIARRGTSIGLCLASVEQVGPAGAELRLAMEAGATLVLASPQAKRQLGYRVRQGGWMITAGFFNPGEEPSMLAPPGDIEVELLSWGMDGVKGVAETRTVTAGAGERLRVEFEAPAPR